ncbi:TPA: hypothetical protein QDB03_000877 [Burkholderia vietnamiensis]|nr:hypothetical protein [Burkholderia vietnamiensis]HDR9081085.1 hypothetical protein [Burkholderia vietnamiensis]
MVGWARREAMRHVVRVSLAARVGFGFGIAIAIAIAIAVESSSRRTLGASAFERCAIAAGLQRSRLRPRVASTDG